MRMVNKQELKPGLVIFQRSDVKHSKWHCRIKVPDKDLYKLLSLDTTDVNAAKQEAFRQEIKLHVKVEDGIPIFDKPFADVAKDYAAFQKQRADAGEITLKRWKVEDGYITKQLVPYIGKFQITLIGEDKWKSYPLWRRSNGVGRGVDKRVSDWTLRAEMTTLRAIMLYAATKKLIPDGNTKAFGMRRLKLGKPRGEAFMPEEYRKLYTHSHKWVAKAENKKARWYREMFHNFMLIMTNTGLRPPEARNFLRRDKGEPVKGPDGRSFLPINVRGKGKYRVLVAPLSVETYLERVIRLADRRLRELGREPTPDTPIFITYAGAPAISLYASLFESLMSKEEANLLYSAAGKRRSTYSFRHTYATFRLMRGTDVFFLAKQMGTSVQMIEDYYGHITPVSNADRILQGIPGWEPTEDVAREISASVNAGGAGKKASKPRTKK